MSDPIQALKAKIEAAAKEAAQEWAREASKILKESVLDDISKGISPVAGKSTFIKYSDSYKDVIKSGKFPGKNIQPVNLKATGEMLRNLKSKVNADGSFELYFDGRSGEIATYHSEMGAGVKKVIRRIFPKSGTNEDFSYVTTKKIVQLFVDILTRKLKE